MPQEIPLQETSCAGTYTDTSTGTSTCTARSSGACKSGCGNGRSRIYSMLDNLKILHYNLGKRKQVQWSLLNDNALEWYTVLATVEPYLYADPETAQPRHTAHRQWQAITPTVHREDGHLRHSYRAMLWVNVDVQARQIPVESHDIAAAVISLQTSKALVISAYDPRTTERSPISRDRVLEHKIILLQGAIDLARAEEGSDLQVVICSDLNQHSALWGGLGRVATARENEALPIIHLAQEYGLQSMLPPGTIT
jgi:hypothetical protein